MQSATAFQRTPLVISAGNLVAGPVHASFADGDRESLLHGYLVLIRQLRGQQREPTITLRGEDISALAEHLGTSDERILHDLLDRMGATRAQRKALFALFAVGALTIVATGSVALDLAPGDAFAQGRTDVEGVVGLVEMPVEMPVEPVDAVVEVSNAPVVTAPAMVADAAPLPDPESAIAMGDADWEVMVALAQLSQALAEQPAPDVESTDPEFTEGVGVADDGSVVAVAPPPLPEGVGVADDGSIVAVAPPPVP